MNPENVSGNLVAYVLLLLFTRPVTSHVTFTCYTAHAQTSPKKKKSIQFNGSEEIVELILRTVISVNQLRIYGAVADLWTELDPDSRNQNEGEICESLEIPTEIPIVNAISQSSTSSAQGDLLQEYERKFAELPDDQKLSKPCSDAGFLKEIGKGQFFIGIEEGPEVMLTACREYTQPRNLKTSRTRGWIRSNTKIGQVLDAKIYPHEGRYCADIMIESLFKDQTDSWVRVVKGITKYVTETSEEIPVENVQLFISTGRPVVRAKPRPKLGVNLSTTYVPIHERKWIDINPATFSQSCFQCQNSSSNYCDMIRTFLEKTMEQYDLNDEFKVKFLDTLQWRVDAGEQERREENISILLESLFVR